MSRLFWLLFISLFFIFKQAVATELKQHPKELQKLFIAALENSPRLQIAKANLAYVGGQQQLTNSYKKVDVRLKSELSYAAMKNQQFPRTANQLVGTYPLYQPDINNLAEAESFALKAAKLQLESERQLLFFEISKDYFQYHQQLAQIKFLEQEHRLIKNLLTLFKQRLELGEKKFNLIATMQAELDANQTSLLFALEKKWALQIKLEELVGKKVLIQGLATPPLPTKVNLQNMDVTQHPKLQRLMMLEKSATKKINYQQTKDSLKLDAFMAGVYNDSNGNFYDDMQGIRGGVKLEIPLYIGGRTSANIAKARANKNIANAKYQALKLKLIADSKTAHLTYNSSLAMIVTIKSSIIYYKQSIQAVEHSIISGSQDGLDLIKAERLLNKAKEEMNITRIKAWLNWYKFIWSTGRL